MKYLILLIYLTLILFFVPSAVGAQFNNLPIITSELSVTGKVTIIQDSVLIKNHLPKQKIVLGLESDRVQVKIIDRPKTQLDSAQVIIDLSKLNLDDYSQIDVKNYSLHGIGLIKQQRNISTFIFIAKDINEEGLWTVEFIFPKGVLKPTFWNTLMYWSANSSIVWFVISFLLLILVNIILLFVLFRRFYSDFCSRSKNILRAPPTNLYSPAVALLEHQNDTPRAIAAGILYLAARGYLIVIKKNNHFYIAKCHQPPDYLPLDCEIYHLFFGRWFAWSQKEILIESSWIIFNEMAGEIYHYIYYDLQQKRLFTKDYRLTIHKTRLLGIMLYFISFIMFLISLHVLPYPPFASLIWISLIISSSIIVHISNSFSVRTKKGTKERKLWQKFKNHLCDSSPALVIDLPMDIYLHYAVALNCEKEWLAKFSSDKYKNPVWFKNFDQDSQNLDNIEIVNFILELCNLINKYKPPEEI